MAKKEETKEKVPATYPMARDGKYVCSDGTEFSDAYYANNYEQKIRKDNGTIK